MGGFGSGLSGDQERPGLADLVQSAGPEKRTERGQDRGGPSAPDDHISNTDREERIYSRAHETNGCLVFSLTGLLGSRSDLGLGAEIECYGAHHGADRRVVQEAEAAMKIRGSHEDKEKKNVSEDLRFAIIEAPGRGRSAPDVEDDRLPP
jgi:hypothetical protein